MTDIYFPFEQLEATVGVPFRKSLNPLGLSLDTTIDVVGPLPPGLEKDWGGTTISGTPTHPGTYKVKVVEKRTKTITIRVRPGKITWSKRNW